MQRASGQYDHLARIPRTRPRQSSGRRSLASWDRCRAAPRRAPGMEAAVRNAGIESKIDCTGWNEVSAEGGFAGNGIFRCRDRRPKSTAETIIVRQRPRTSKKGGKIPAERASFQSITVSEVREDCVVETEGTKLPAPLAVISNQSLTTVPGTESWRGKTGRDSSARPAVERRPWWDPARLASKSSRFIIAEAVSSRQFTQAR
jgi:hypothetical protein